MKLRLNKLMAGLVMAGGAVALVGCGGGGAPDFDSAALNKAAQDTAAARDAIAAQTPITVVDGAATGCTVRTADNAQTATENSSLAGVYSFAVTVPNNTVVTATGCRDTDTGLLLAAMRGVVVNQAAIISPISSLVVDAALATGATTVTPAAIATATTRVNTALGLPASFAPTDPVNGNFAKDVTTNSVSQAVQTVAFKIAAMMKTAEKSGDATSTAAIAKNIAASTTAINFTNATAVTALMPATVVDKVSVTAVVNKVASATSAANAGAMVQAIAVSLNSTAQASAAATVAATVSPTATITLVNAADAVAAQASALAAAKAAADAAAAAVKVATGGA